MTQPAKGCVARKKQGVRMKPGLSSLGRGLCLIMTVTVIQGLGWRGVWVAEALRQVGEQAAM